MAIIPVLPATEIRADLTEPPSGDWSVMRTTEYCIAQSVAKDDPTAVVMVIRTTDVETYDSRFGYILVMASGLMESKRTDTVLRIRKRPYPVYQVAAGLLIADPRFQLEMLQAMVKGKTMTLASGHNEDLGHLTFSLLGFSDSYKSASESCSQEYLAVLEGEREVIRPTRPEPSAVQLFVEGRSSTSIQESFDGGVGAIIELEGDGSSDLDLVVVNSKGDEVCASLKFEDREVCEWYPVETQTYQITIINHGNGGNNFKLSWN